jgi:hypothetical protein
MRPLFEWAAFDGKAPVEAANHLAQVLVAYAPPVFTSPEREPIHIVAQPRQLAHQLEPAHSTQDAVLNARRLIRRQMLVARACERRSSLANRLSHRSAQLRIAGPSRVPQLVSIELKRTARPVILVEPGLCQRVLKDERAACRRIQHTIRLDSDGSTLGRAVCKSEHRLTRNLMLGIRKHIMVPQPIESDKPRAIYLAAPGRSLTGGIPTSAIKGWSVQPRRNR